MRSTHMQATTRGVVAVVAAFGMTFGAVSVATGDPAPAAEADPVQHEGRDEAAPDPENAGDAVGRMLELAREVEETNQRFLAGQQHVDELLALQHEQDGRVAAAQELLDQTQQRVDAFQSAVNVVAIANYRGARTNGLQALITSASPQQLLDQLSVLDRINLDTHDRIADLREAKTEAELVRAEAQEAARDAARAREEAEAAQAVLEAERHGLVEQIDHVRELYAAMTGADRDALAGDLMPDGFDPAQIVDGGGVGYAALQVALTRLGKPYVWGATGPDSFDCSGLVQWSFGQVGVGTSRTAAAQSTDGVDVALEDIRPGDIVTFYPEISHVGIYAGNGMMVHASTFGVPVKIQPIADFPIHNIRRY